MYAKTHTIGLLGLDGYIVEVEADVSPGLFCFSIVGLGNKSIQEAKERVVSAVKNSGLKFPAKKVTVNLAPADLLKSGPAYDIPIAVAIMAASGQIPEPEQDSLFYGELALDGRTKFSKGILCVADFAVKQNFKQIFLPEINANEAGIIAGIAIKSVKELTDIINHYSGKEIRNYYYQTAAVDKKPALKYDLTYILGQERAKRALTIAAAGGHNLLFSGSPGSGKTYLARSIIGILPDLDLTEAIEVSKIHSISGKLQQMHLISSRPFRAPHHTCSLSALIGGGTIPHPGEISLAHLGVLFMDEFNEFPGILLESLRQPLEDKIINITRAAGTITLPCNFMLLAAMNPCACGYYGDSSISCKCSNLEISKFYKKISGPILDRIDLQFHMPRIGKSSLLNNKYDFSARKELKELVQQARARQQVRQKLNNFCYSTNADMTPGLLKKHAGLDSGSRNLLNQAFEKLGLSARSFYKIIKIARTIADLESSPDITEEHMAEALSYRTNS